MLINEKAWGNACQKFEKHGVLEKGMERAKAVSTDCSTLQSKLTNRKQGDFKLH